MHEHVESSQNAAPYWVALLLISFLALSWVYFPESTDDAYITLQYAKQWIQGNGLVFNTLERIEGFSNFSWLAILTAAGKIGLPMPVVMKVIGMICGGGTAILIWKSARRLFPLSPIIPFVSTGLVTTSSFFALWSVDGLETGWFTFLLTAAIYLLLQSDKKISRALWLVLPLIALTRPEGILFCILSSVIICCSRRQPLIMQLFTVLSYSVAYIAFTIFRYAYYGTVTAHTTEIKFHPGVQSMELGFDYIKLFLHDSGWILFIAIVVGSILISRHRGLAVPAIVVLGGVFFLLLSGGDFMYGYRFIVPVFPAVALLAGASIITLRKRPMMILAAGILLAVTSISQWASLPSKHLSSDNLTYRSNVLLDVSQFLQRNGVEPSDIVVVSEAGIIPYSISANTIDFIALTSDLEHLYPNGNLDVDYLLSFSPRYLIISTVVRDGVVSGRLIQDDQIRLHPKVQMGYREVFTGNVKRDRSFNDAIYYKYFPSPLIEFHVLERT